MSQLSNFLRTYRKRSGFSQVEVAFLLGVHDGPKVCWHERYAGRPSLRNGLAYEVIFRTPARQLFKGMYQKVEQDVERRAAVLKNRLSKAKPSRTIARRLAALETITQPHES